MGKAAREKWERRLEMLRLAAQDKPGHATTRVNTPLTWATTFALGAIGGVSNVPWQLSASMFLLSLPFCWIAAARTMRTSPRLLMKIAAPMVTVMLTCINAWVAESLVRVPVELTEAAKEKFMHYLRASPAKPEMVLLSCSQSNEAACAYAEQFISVIQRVPWKVAGPFVDRVALGRSIGEILIADFGPPLIDSQNPDQGVWTKLMPWRPQVQTAFKEIGIATMAINDPDLPRTQTRIHFGRVPTSTLSQTIKSWFF